MVTNTISYKYPRDDPNALIHKAYHSSFQTRVCDKGNDKNEESNDESIKVKVWIIDEKTGLLFGSVTEWIDFIESAYPKEYPKPNPAPREKSNSNRPLAKLNMLNCQMKIFKPLLGNHF